MQPVTLNGGMKMPSWWGRESNDCSRATSGGGNKRARESIQTNEAECACLCWLLFRCFRHDICSLSNLDKEDFKGLDSSRSTVESLLTAEMAAGTPSRRILLGGFSQGAAVSLFTGLQFAHPLGGILALSGYLPYNQPDKPLGAIVHESNQATPILGCHGEADAVVRFAIGQRSFAAIQAARKENITFKAYKVGGNAGGSLYCWAVALLTRGRCRCCSIVLRLLTVARADRSNAHRCRCSSLWLLCRTWVITRRSKRWRTWRIGWTKC